MFAASRKHVASRSISPCCPIVKPSKTFNLEKFLASSRIHALVFFANIF